MQRYEEMKQRYMGNEQWLDLSELKDKSVHGYAEIKRKHTQQHSMSITNFKRIFHLKSPKKNNGY